MNPILRYVLPIGISCLMAVSSQAQTITVKGSDTLLLLGQRWAEDYMKKYPGVSIQVTGGGSGTGIAALINGTTDICEASRPIKEAEKQRLKAKRKVDVYETPVALDGIAIYVNDKNPVNTLTLSQIKDIYTGEITNWNEVGGKNAPIILYSRENNSGTYAFLKEHVLQDEDYSPRAQTLPGQAAVINAIAKDPNGIGYGGIAYGHGVKHLMVKKNANSPGVVPTLKSVISREYPISRYLYWYTAGKPTGAIKKLADWVLSSEGQSIVEKVGYFPLPKSSHK